MDIIIPKELKDIKNPIVRTLYEKTYELYDVKLNEYSYKMLLDKNLKYIITISKNNKIKVIAEHNANLDEIIESKKTAYYLEFIVDSWKIKNLNEVTESCTLCFQSRYLSNECLMCKKSVKLDLIGHRYIYFPVNNQLDPIDPDEEQIDTIIRLRIYIDGEKEHDIDINLADDKKYSWLASIDIPRESKIATVVAINTNLKFEEIQNKLKSIKCQYVDSRNDDKLRPQLRYSQPTGWINDPNGLVYHNGIYHMFYQANPFGNQWNPPYWGHATTKDFVKWKTHKLALRPRNILKGAKGLCFSGSGISINSEELLIVFTDTNRGECMASSYDNGETWKFYENNPIIKHMGRDPKIIWHEESKGWIIIVYSIIKIMDVEKSGFVFYRSEDRIKWTECSFLEGFYECPEFIRLKIPDSDKYKWVIHDVNSKYLIGEFDGYVFTPDNIIKEQMHYGKFKASQCFNNTNDRCISIGWATITMGMDMCFNQAFSLPMELYLGYDRESKLRLCSNVIKEMDKLVTTVVYENEKMSNMEMKLEGELFKINMKMNTEIVNKICIIFGKNELYIDLGNYTMKSNQNITIPLYSSVTDKSIINISIIIDRPMYEVMTQFSNYTEKRIDLGENLESIKISSENNINSIEKIKIQRLHSINLS